MAGPRHPHPRLNPHQILFAYNFRYILLRHKFRASILNSSDPLLVLQQMEQTLNLTDISVGHKARTQTPVRG